MHAFLSEAYLCSQAVSPFGCDLNGIMQTVSSELSRKPLGMFTATSLGITCLAGFMVLEVRARPGTLNFYNQTLRLEQALLKLF